MGKFVFNGINKVYPNNVQAVFDFNLEIADGEFVAFVGPSGCGKSTTLRMVAGLESITSGELTLDGEVINNKAPSERNISMVFQDYALYPNLTVYDNVGMSYRVRRKDEVDIYNIVMETSEALDISQYLRRLPGELSGGQKQRVSLGRAVSRHPKAFLMDEPLSNLDAKLRASMRVEIKRLQKSLGVTTIYVTHDQVEAMTMADRIVVMKDGRIQQVGTPMDVYNYPVNMFVGSFIGSPEMNYIKGQIQNGCFTVGGYALRPAGEQQAKLTDGQEVFFGIRPEHIRLNAEQKPGTFPVKISHAEYLGSYYHVFFNFAGVDMTAKIDAADFVQADTLYVDFMMQLAHYFDGKTSMRL